MMQPAIAEEVVTLKTIAVQANCAVDPFTVRIPWRGGPVQEVIT